MKFNSTQAFTLICSFFFLSNTLNAQCYGGKIFSNSNVTSIDLCTILPDLEVPLYTSGYGAEYDFVLTDDNNVITGFLNNNTITVGEVATGSTRIWGFSYTGNRTAIVGELVWGLAFSDDCYSISNNAIFLNVVDVDGGTLSNEDGTDEIYICTNDNVPDVFGFFNNSTSSGKYIYLVTSEDNVLLTTTENNYFDATYASLGKCKIWGLSYTGELLIQPEMNITNHQLSSGCGDLSDNFILVDKNYVEGGNLQSSLGESHIFIDVSDGNPDEVTFVTNSWADPNYVYVITDASNHILEITADNKKDFENSGPGIVRVWGFAYTGDILLEPGDLIFGTQFSSGCFDISTSAIQIEKTGEPVTGGEVDGGVVSFEEGGSFAVLCPEADGESEVQLVANSSSTESYTYIITDGDDAILTFTVTPTIFLIAFLPGTYRIYGVSHVGALDFEQGDDVLTTTLSAQPFDLSGNFVTIVVSIPEASEIAANVGTGGLICISPEGIDITHVGDIIGNIDYIIVDENNTIIAIDENTPVNYPEDLNGIGRIYAVAHFDPLTIEVGDEFTGDLSDGCFDVSDNFIEVNEVVKVDGATVSLTTGETALSICVGDGVSDFLTYETTSQSDAEYGYIITDDEGNILAFIIGNGTDFDAAVAGVYRVYGYASTGNIIAFPGNHISDMLTDGCYDVSENYIEVDAGGTFGGVIFLEDESGSAVLCAGGEDNTIEILVNTTSSAAYAFVITNAFGIIYDVITDPIYTFPSDLPEDRYFIAGYSYLGELLSPIGEPVFSAQISTECFQQSLTFIEVFFDQVDAGEIATLDGTTQEVLCVSDDIEDVLSFQSNTAFSGTYAYLITAEDGTILEILDGTNSFDFENLGVGNYVVTGLAYTGNLLAMIGDNFENTNLSVSCYALSNPVFVELVSEGEACDPLIIGDGTQNRVVSNNSIAPANVMKSKLTLTASPNPMENEVTIYFEQSDSEHTTSKILITDISGRLMFEANLIDSNALNILTESWTPGIYLMTLISENGVATEKLLKE